MNIRDFYCSRCSLQFDKKSIFDMHLSIVHKENNQIKEEQMICNNKPNPKVPLICDICYSNFENQILLKLHVASIHEGKKPFKCEICDYQCSTKRDMKKHVAAVHEGKKPFKCDICDYSCSRKCNMKKHVESVHKGKKPFKCSECDALFSQKVNLNRHVATVHVKFMLEFCNI